MRLYTKGGDKGETGLIGGQRVGKDHPRVDAYGQVDELNASVGLAAAACEDEDWRSRLRIVQRKLFDLGAELANPASDGSSPPITDGDVARLEEWIDVATEAVTPLKQFILPGGCELASRFHVARTVSRSVERVVVALSRHAEVDDGVLVYMNRLSDLLFAWARLANAHAGIEDVIWVSSDPDDVAGG